MTRDAFNDRPGLLWRIDRTWLRARPVLDAAFTRLCAALWYGTKRRP